MRIAVLTGVLACALILYAAPGKSSAATLEELPINTNDSTTLKLAVLEEEDDLADSSNTSQKTPAETAVTHTVNKSETLSSIAKLYQTTWQRIFYKNTTMDDPDVLSAGDVLIIPGMDEVLEERPIPANQPTWTPARRSSNSIGTSVAAPARSGDSSGNRYVYGYCTWYVKNRRPDLPNNLGNASTWVSRAAAQGIPTGSSPQAGAVGQRGNHVVYIESVNADGTVTVSEMNYQSWNVVSSRTVSADYFYYIY